MDHPIISKRGSGGGGHGGGGHGGGEGGHGGDEGGHGDSGEPGEPGGGHGEPEIGDGPLDSGPEAPPPNDPAEVAADTVTQITNALLPPQSRQNTTPANPNPVHIDTTGFQEPLPIPPAPANPPRGPLPLRPQGPGPAVTPASNDRFDAFFQAVPGYQQLDSQYDQAQASYSVAYRSMFPPVNISFTNDRYLRQSHRRRNPRSVSSDPRNNFATVSFPRPFPLCSPPTNSSTFRILVFLKSYTGPLLSRPTSPLQCPNNKITGRS